MNILYINHYAGSPEMGMEFRPYYLAREWVKMGHTVSIIAGDYSHLRKQNPYVENDMLRQEIDGINYYWLRTGAYEGNGVARAVTMERFVRKIFARAKHMAQALKPSVVIASSTYPLDTYAAQRIANYANAKYIHEFHDLWPATLYEIGGMSRRHPFVKAMQVAEDSACMHCDAAVALAPYTKDYFMQHGLNPRKFNNIQNGVVEEEWEDYESISAEHQEFFDAHQNDFIVGFFGGHALSNALDESLNVAKIMMDQEDTIFVFVGDGVEKSRLIKRSIDEGISNTFFLPPVKKKAIPDLVRHFDCSYMTGLPSPLYRFGLCLNKMYDSMMAGLPIVCAFDAPDTLVRQFDCGYQCSPEDSSEVANAIRQIYNLTPEQRTEMGNRGKDAVLEHFTYNKLAKQFIDVIKGSDAE